MARPRFPPRQDEGHHLGAVFLRGNEQPRREPERPLGGVHAARGGPTANPLRQLGLRDVEQSGPQERMQRRYLRLGAASRENAQQSRDRQPRHLGVSRVVGEGEEMVVTFDAAPDTRSVHGDQRVGAAVGVLVDRAPVPGRLLHVIRQVVGPHGPGDTFPAESAKRVAPQPRGLRQAGQHRVGVAVPLFRSVQPHDLGERRQIVAVHEARQPLERRVQEPFVGLDLEAQGVGWVAVEVPGYRAHVGASDAVPQPW